MPRMTEEEANQLDERWTKSTPEIDESKPGFFSRQGFTMISVDNVTNTYLRAKADALHKTPSEIVKEIVLRELSYA